MLHRATANNEWYNIALLLFLRAVDIVKKKYDLSAQLDTSYGIAVNPINCEAFIKTFIIFPSQFTKEHLMALWQLQLNKIAR